MVMITSRIRGWGWDGDGNSGGEEQEEEDSGDWGFVSSWLRTKALTARPIGGRAAPHFATTLLPDY